MRVPRQPPRNFCHSRRFDLTSNQALADWETLEVLKAGKWTELSTAHRDMTAPRATPSDLPIAMAPDHTHVEMKQIRYTNVSPHNGASMLEYDSTTWASIAKSLDFFASALLSTMTFYFLCSPKSTLHSPRHQFSVSSSATSAPGTDSVCDFSSLCLDPTPFACLSFLSFPLFKYVSLPSEQSPLDRYSLARFPTRSCFSFSPSLFSRLSTSKLRRGRVALSGCLIGSVCERFKDWTGHERQKTLLSFTDR